MEHPLNFKFSGLPYRFTHNILVHDKQHWIWLFLFIFYQILSNLWQSIITSSLALVSSFKLFIQLEAIEENYIFQNLKKLY
jgi:hypothetical protein